MRLSLVTLTATAALALAACGSSTDPPEPASSSSAASSEAAADEAPVFTQENIASLASATDESTIQHGVVKRVAGKVFDVQRGEGGAAIQVYTDPRNSEGNLILLFDPEDPDAGGIATDDILQFTGTVYDLFEGKNGFGADLLVPRVEVTEWDYASAAALDPAIKTFKKARTQDLGGVQITIRRVEITNNETRIKVRYRNFSGEDFGEIPSLIADGEEVETAYNDSNKEPASSVSPGASTTGTLTYDPVEPDARLELRYDGYDANYDSISATFTFGR